MRIEFHEAGFKELLTSSATKALVKKEADRMADQANSVASTTDPEAGFEYYEVEDGTTDRARYRVRTADGANGARAIRHEAKTQALQKSL